MICRSAIRVIWLFPLTAAATRADQVIVGGSSFPGAKILGLEQGRLRFHTADGRTETAWISQVELLIIDRPGVFEDFNQAERYQSTNEPEKAAVRYERTLRTTDGWWSELTASRLVTAYDRAGHIDKATQYFLRVLRGQSIGPAAAARLMPRSTPTKRDARFARAIEQLDAALAGEVATDTDVRTLVELARYDLLRRAGDDRAARAAPTVGKLPIGEPLRTEAVYSILLSALHEGIKNEDTGVGLAAVDRAIRDCPEGSLPGYLLLKGRWLLRAATSREDLVRACWPFLRIAIHMPDDPRAAEGLLGAAGALERLGQVDQATSLLQECLTRQYTTMETRRDAEAMLSRLLSAPPASP